MTLDAAIDSEVPKQALMRAMSATSDKRGPKFGISVLPPEAPGPLEVCSYFVVKTRYLN